MDTRLLQQRIPCQGALGAHCIITPFPRSTNQRASALGHQGLSLSTGKHRSVSRPGDAHDHTYGRQDAIFRLP